MPRPSWSETWLAVARELSKRSTCPRLSVGSVLVNGHQEVISTGYNGAPRSVAHCTEVGCAMSDGSCWRAIHAEENVLIQAARSGQQAVGSTLYSTHIPCVRCARMLYQAGVTLIIYAEPSGSKGHAGNFTVAELEALGLRLERA